MPDSRAAILVLSMALFGACVPASAPVRLPRRQTAQERAGLRYLLHLPAAYESRSDWPVILFLHGAGERGRDLDLVTREALPRVLETLPDFPFVVVSPQEEIGRLWTPEVLSAFLDEVTGNYRVDPTRVYVTGLSTGATMALELAIREPARIAAIAAVSPTRIPPALCAMKDVPVWIFQNTGDERVPPSRVKKLARELEGCGGRGEVKLTMYPREGHDAWTETYRRQDVYDWMLSHRRSAPSLERTPLSPPAGRGSG
jgi:predicted peptidase